MHNSLKKGASCNNLKRLDSIRRNEDISGENNFEKSFTGGVPNQNQKTLFGKGSYWAFLFLLSRTVLIWPNSSYWSHPQFI